MPTHHNLDRYLEEYIAAAGIADDRKGPLFRTTRGRSAELTNNFLLQPDVWRMIRRRALAAGIKTEIGCHTVIPSGPLESPLTSRTAGGSRPTADRGSGWRHAPETTSWAHLARARP